MSNEADTCRRYVVPKLQAAGWDAEPHQIREQVTLTDARIVLAEGEVWFWDAGRLSSRHEGDLSMRSWTRACPARRKALDRRMSAWVVSLSLGLLTALSFFRISLAGPGSNVTKTGDPAPMSPKAIYKSVADSVVIVDTDVSSGTGFFIAADLVATCAHVLKQCTRISINGSRETTWVVAQVYALDEGSDLALLRISGAAGRKPLVLGNLQNRVPGDEVVVIGNPLGFLTNTLTTGVLSAKRIVGEVPTLQITAAISPGSSGSPILDVDGRVIGVASSKFVQGESLNMGVSAEGLQNLLSHPTPVPANDYFAMNKRAALVVRDGVDRGGRAEVPSPKRTRDEMTGQFGRRLGQLYEKLFEIQYEMNTLSSSTVVPRAFREMDERCGEMMDIVGGFDNFLAGMDQFPDWSDKAEGLADQLMGVLKAIGELETSLSDTSAQLQLGERERARDGLMKYARSIDRVRRSLATVLLYTKRLAGFSWDKLEADIADISEPGLFVAFPRIANVLPDPVFPNAPRIGWVGRVSPLIVGDLIVSIRSKEDGLEGQKVGSWHDVIVRLLREKHGRELLLKVNRGGLPPI